jgi:hypothetical protein
MYNPEDKEAVKAQNRLEHGTLCRLLEDLSKITTPGPTVLQLTESFQLAIEELDLEYEALQLETPSY